MAFIGVELVGVGEKHQRPETEKQFSSSLPPVKTASQKIERRVNALKNPM
jgi:hypothetical protein